MESTVSAQGLLFDRQIAPRRDDRLTSASAICVFQDLLFDEGLWAIKESVRFEHTDELQQFLEAQLPQNSQITRRRYAQSILKWFFPSDKCVSLASRVWTAYGDESLVREMLRLAYLQAEPLVGQCVSESLYPIAVGSLIPHSYLDQYLRAKTRQASAKAEKRLKSNLRKLGFLAKAKSGYDLLKDVKPSATAVFLAFHHQFAAAGVRSVELPAVFANPFWQLLGLKSEDAIRAILRDADSAGYLGKYVIADQLELVTPRYTFAELVQRKIRL